MTVNIICTSKPIDGLLYYSYEYCCLLNHLGIASQLIIVCHRRYTPDTYRAAIINKYTVFDNVVFDQYHPAEDDVTLVMGRSMITLSWQSFKDYTVIQQATLRSVFGSRVISVYSENHPEGYPRALAFYGPEHIVDLCDREVYPEGQGLHFEKTINFDIYKPHVDRVQFKYLFQGSNAEYYATAEKFIDQYPDHGILTYREKYVNINYNNIFAPIENLLGIFDTYVYVKETFDPAPRIVQECKYFNKGLIYLRDPAIHDGGSVYYTRDITEPDAAPILAALEQLQ